MSDFDESFHLRSELQSDGFELLKHLNLKGVVFEPVNGWVSLLPQGELNSSIEAIAQSTPCLVLHYLHHEKYSWAFNIFKDGSLISSYACVWTPVVYTDDRQVNYTLLESLALEPCNIQSLRTLLRIREIGELRRLKPAQAFIRLMGLKYCAGLAGHRLPEVARHILSRNISARYLG